jgi:hypothetical protein
MSREPLTFIGETYWRDLRRPFGSRPADRRAHMYVIGKTGTGKSSLLEGMIRQDLLAGHGLALFDPHGDLAERLALWMPESRKADLIYLDVPDPTQQFGFNPLEGVSPLRRSVAANGIVEALKKIFSEAWGVRLEYILRSALLLLLEQPQATLADVVRLFHDKDFRKEAAERSTNEHVKRFWTIEFEKLGRQRAEAVSPIENKLGSLLVDPFVSRILTASKSTFNPRTAMDEGKVILVNLAKGKIGEAPAMLFGGLLVTALGLAGLRRADMPQKERRDFFIYMDEFQTFTTWRSRTCWQNYVSILSGWCLRTNTWTRSSQRSEPRFWATPEPLSSFGWEPWMPESSSRNFGPTSNRTSSPYCGIERSGSDRS